MSRLRYLLIGLAAIATLTAAVGGSLAASHKVKVKKLYGQTGPGYDIKVTNPGFKRIKRVNAGLYTFVIQDRSTIHDFHLVGPGVNKSTRLRFLGTKTWAKLRLKKGTYSFFCKPHKKGMHGSFKVV